MIFSDPISEESENEDPLFDITGKLVNKGKEKGHKKDKGKQKKLIVRKKEELKIKHRVRQTKNSLKNLCKN